jgi:DNA-binding SARP family transcriptional activator
METVAARVLLLDGFGVRRAGEVVDLPPGVQRLVAYLGLAARPARSAVAGALWPDASESLAHNSLRSALWRLQQVAPGLVDAPCGALALADGVQVDVRDLTSWARPALDPRTDVDGVLPVDVGRSGDLLPGWYDDWVLLEREGLRQLRMHAFEALANKLSRAGRHGEAVQAAHTAIRSEPLRESANRTLVRVHLAEGNLAEALRAYESFRAVLRRELGVAPTPAMESLVAELRRSPLVRAFAS